MALRVSLVVVLAALSGAVACASVVGLDSSDVKGDSELPPGETTTTASGLVIPQALKIGDVKCGDSKPASLILGNSSDKPIDFEVFLPPDEVFGLEGAKDNIVKGTVPPRGQTTLKVVAKPTAAGSATVEVVVRSGDESKTVDATVEVTGASLVVNPVVVDFGDVRMDTISETKTAVFVNDGNQPITITSFDRTGDDGFTTESNIIIPAHGQKAANFSMSKRKVDDVPVSAVLTPVVSGLCGAKPTLMLNGRRTNQEVIVPSVVDTGRFGCKTNPITGGKLTITNYGKALTATIGQPTKFLVSLSSVPLEKGDGNSPKTAEVTFTPKSEAVNLAAPGTVDEDVTISVPGADPPTRTVHLKATVFGAVLTVDPGSGTWYQFGLQNIPDNNSGYGRMTNSGDTQTCLDFSMTGGDSNAFTAPKDGRFEAGKTTQFSVAFRASQSGNYSSTVTWKQISCGSSGESAPICSSPANVAVSGRRSSGGGSSNGGSNGGF